MSDKPTDLVALDDEIARAYGAIHAPDNLAEILAKHGWTYTGPDADLIRALLADPHRNDHILQVTESGWTLQHPVVERVTGELFDCHIGQEEDQLSALRDTHLPGKYVAWLTEGVIWTEPIAEPKS